MLIMMMVTVNLVGCGSTEVTAASLKKGFLAPYVQIQTLVVKQVYELKKMTMTFLMGGESNLPGREVMDIQPGQGRQPEISHRAPGDF